MRAAGNPGKACDKLRMRPPGCGREVPLQWVAAIQSGLPTARGGLRLHGSPSDVGKHAGGRHSAISKKCWSPRANCRNGRTTARHSLHPPSVSLPRRCPRMDDGSLGAPILHAAQNLSCSRESVGKQAFDAAENCRQSTTDIRPCSCIRISAMARYVRAIPHQALWTRSGNGTVTSSNRPGRRSATAWNAYLVCSPINSLDGSRHSLGKCATAMLRCAASP